MFSFCTQDLGGPDARAQAFVSITDEVVADSDEVAWAIRDNVARDYEMMSPGFGASLA
jgi:hypothetical protein